MGIKKENKRLEVSLERLTPPKTDTSLDIDFSYLTNNSSFQRAIIEFIKKYIPGFENVKHRGSREVMKQSFNENMRNYKEVMEELKLTLQKRNEKLESIGEMRKNG